MKQELDRIGFMVKSLQEGPAWHGKSLEESFAGLDYALAAKKPFPGGHSIWELILHLSAWRKFALEKISKNEAYQIEIGSEIDWPPLREISESNWQNCLLELQKLGQALQDSFKNQTDILLNEHVPGKAYTFYILLHGIVQHDAYHCGQIVLTRKMLEQILN